MTHAATDSHLKARPVSQHTVHTMCTQSSTQIPRDPKETPRRGGILNMPVQEGKYYTTHINPDI